MNRTNRLVRTYSSAKKVCLIFIIISQSLFLFGQESAKIIEKFSPTIRAAISLRINNIEGKYVIAVSDRIVFRQFVQRTLSVSPDYEYAASNTFILSLPWRIIIDSIAPRAEVIYIDELRIPKEEVAVSNLDISANKGNVIHARYPQYSGSRINFSIKENRPDTSDIDFRGRYIQTAFAPTVLSSHATIMATIVAGAGNTYYEGKGIAPGSTITAANFNTLLPEPDGAYQQYGISLQNHSYGTAIENFYGADAMAYDESVRVRRELVHVFSAGNAGTQSSSNGNYSGITGFANLTGSFKMAKNIITVGHTDSTGTVLPPSSKGPAYDGRVRPELVAFGEDGSSGAAAIVSGIALVLQDAYKQKFGSLPSADLVKATLINSADDVGPVGIDYQSGYGSANGIMALRGVLANHSFSDISSQGSISTHDLIIPPNIRSLKITITWTDPPANPNATRALRNDLDMELLNIQTVELWLPWVLNSFPHIDSLQKLPVRKLDTLNNVEHITLDHPQPGSYVIAVHGTRVTTPTQPYSIAYQLDTIDRFEWYYPTRVDNIFPGRVHTLRWRSTYTSNFGDIEYSIDGGNTWISSGTNIDLSKGYYKWTAPFVTSVAMLRVKIGSQFFLTDSFSIADRLNTRVGFDCPDSFLLYWNRVPNATGYRVYRLGQKYMEPLSVTQDTAILLLKTGEKYHAVAPIIGNKEAVRGYGFDFSTQGVGCYVRSFFATLVDRKIELDLILGTTYNIRKVSIEKFDGVNFNSILEANNISTVLAFTDDHPTQGVNRYRARIELSDGRFVYSSIETVYYFPNLPYVIYPNPVRQGQSVTLLSADVTETAQLKVFNSMGQKLYERDIDDTQLSLPPAIFSAGLYFIRVLHPVSGSYTLKLLVQ